MSRIATLTLALALLGASPLAAAERILWLDAHFKPVPPAEATYKGVLADESNAGWPVEVRWADSDRVRYRGFIDRPSPSADDSHWIGHYESYYKDNGALAEVGVHDAQGAIHGLAVDFAKNGTRTSEALYRHGVLDGQLRCYNRITGLLHCRTPYVDGKIAGIKQSYYQGQLYKLETFRDDARNGMAETYSFDGEHLVRRAHYRNDKIHGTARRWNENGRLVELSHHVDGKQDGEQRAWYRNGQLRSVSHFRAGQPVGLQLAFDLHGRPTYRRVLAEDGSGDLIASTSYKDGKPSIEMHHVERDGQTIKRMRWHDAHGYVTTRREENPDTGHREDISYNSNGSLRRHTIKRDGHPVGRQYVSDGYDGADYRIEHYDDQGRRHGEQREYEDRELVAHSRYRHGTQIGTAVERGYSGERIESHYDDQGKRHGVVRKTDADGRLLSLAHYRHGTPVGEYVEYRDYDRKQIAHGRYVDGKRDGAWRITPNSQTWEGEYRNGNQAGRWVAIDDHGYPISTGRYDAQGRRHGPWYEFAANGRMIGRGGYAHGKRDGLFASYREDGSPIHETRYRDGQPVARDAD